MANFKTAAFNNVVTPTCPSHSIVPIPALSDSGHEHVQQLADGFIECSISVLANQVKLALGRVVLETSLTKASDDVVYCDRPEEHQDTPLAGRACFTTWDGCLAA